MGCPVVTRTTSEFPESVSIVLSIDTGVLLYLDIIRIIIMCTLHGISFRAGVMSMITALLLSQWRCPFLRLLQGMASILPTSSYGQNCSK